MLITGVRQTPTEREELQTGTLWTILYSKQFPSHSKKASFHYREANKTEIKSYQFLQDFSCPDSNFREDTFKY